MKTLKEITTATMYVDEEVLAAAPLNQRKGELQFFNLGKYISDDELEKEYESRGLIPADWEQLAIWCEANKDDPRKYFGTHWKDKNGKWCYLAFGGWDGSRSVRCNRSRDDGVWGDDWFLAGVPAPGKSAKKSDIQDSSETLNLERAIQMVKDAGYRVVKDY